MQLQSQNDSLHIIDGADNEVCTPVTVNSVSPITNTTITSTVLNQVAQMTLVDADNYRVGTQNNTYTVQSLNPAVTTGTDSGQIGSHDSCKSFNRDNEC